MEHEARGKEFDTRKVDEAQRSLSLNFGGFVEARPPLRSESSTCLTLLFMVKKRRMSVPKARIAVNPVVREMGGVQKEADDIENTHLVVLVGLCGTGDHCGVG